MDRSSLVNREAGSIAIAVPSQASCVIPLVFGIGQALGLRCSQVGVVTSFHPVSASREVALVFRESCLFRLQGSEFGVVALIPAIRAILRVVPEFCGGRTLGLRRG